MLDMKFIRTNPDAVAEALKKRNAQISLDKFLELDKQRRNIFRKLRS